MLRQQKLVKSLVMTNHYTSVNLNITNIYPKKEAHLSLFLYVCVPGMARIQSEIDRPQVVTAKCSEPQVVNSDVKDGGSGVAILLSVRTET